MTRKSWNPQRFVKRANARAIRREPLPASRDSWVKSTETVAEHSRTFPRHVNQSGQPPTTQATTTMKSSKSSRLNQPTEAQRMRLLRINSPLPSGFWTVGCKKQAKKGGYGRSLLRHVNVGHSVGSLEQTSGSSSPQMFTPTVARPSKSRDLLDLGGELHSSGQRDDYDRADLLSPVGQASTNSLFPVFPSFDCPKDCNDEWINDSKVDQTANPLVEDWLLDPLKTYTNGSPLNQEAIKATAPMLRRYVSIPKIHLQFDNDDKKRAKVDMEEKERRRAMNFDIDSALSAVIPAHILNSSRNVPKVEDPVELSSSEDSSDEAEEIVEEIEERPQVKAKPVILPSVRPVGRGMIKPLKRVREGKGGFACNSCRISKTKCEGGFPCMRCERLGRKCTRDEGNKRRRVESNTVNNVEPKKIEMRKIETRTRKKAETRKKVEARKTRKKSETSVMVDNSPPRKESYLQLAKLLVDSQKAQKLSIVGIPDEDAQPKPLSQCYRNAWCVRPFRHPGHCKHANSKRRRRRKPSKMEAEDLSDY
ncbi:hypothetical protein AAMO2058_001326800 [Amorphochlora amoebiformis]